MAAIVVNNPKGLNRIIKETKRKYADIIGRDLEVKGNKTDRNIFKKLTTSRYAEFTNETTFKVSKFTPTITVSVDPTYVLGTAIVRVNVIGVNGTVIQPELYHSPLELLIM